MILISKDSKGKVRVVDISYTFDSPVYTIRRKTGLFNGKMSEQPNITVDKGKVKRTLLQQVELEFDSRVKKYLDKGYQKYEELTDIPFDKISAEDISGLIADEKTNQAGIIKPMLAKDYNKCSINVLERDWYGSRKIDGVRCLLSWTGTEIIATSRGGNNYNASTTHIRNNKQLIQFFKDQPKFVLDGELYKHGLSLQQISGISRLEEPSERTEQLEFWIYDLIDLGALTLSFLDRLDVLLQMQEEYFSEAVFDPYNEQKIKFVPHKKMSGYAAVDLNHNRYITEGYEGIVVRDPEKEYGIGKRDNRMIKYKKYTDEEFIITGFEEGLREEDFVFTCRTKDDKEFKAKPVGTRELKEQYRNDMNNIIGKTATVKFFYYSEDNIPLQPVLKSIREYGE